MDCGRFGRIECQLTVSGLGMPIPFAKEINMPADNHVTRLMNDAITAAAHPGLILVRVCEMLRPKSGYRLPAGRKLSDEQAAAAAMVVTRIVERLDVSLAAVC